MLRSIIILLLLCSPAFCGTMKHDVAEEHYIEYGKKHGFVIRLRGKAKEGMGNPANAIVEGSAVLISQEWILTAAHVVEFMDDPFFAFEEQQYKITKVIKHPDFELYNFNCMGDIALCKIEKKILVNNFPSLYSKQDEVGQICGCAGFGESGKANSTTRKMDHVRRAGSNKVIEVRSDKIVCDMSEKDSTNLEFLPARGDSGGGLFIDGKLAGIHSYIEGVNSLYGDKSLHTRVSHHVEWIESTMSDKTNH